jgi:tetratricopeptide (TPR) repeat protein
MRLCTAGILEYHMLLNYYAGMSRSHFANPEYGHGALIGERVSFGPDCRESGCMHSAAAWSLFFLACTGLFVLLVPLPSFAQSSCAENSSVRKLIQEGRDIHRSYDERKRDFEKVLGSCRQDKLAYQDLSALLRQHQELTGALQWIQRGVKAVPNDPDLTGDLAVLFLSVGKPQEALRAFTGLQSTARVEFYRGLAYRALRDDRAAQQSFSRAFEMGYEDPYVLYALIEQEHVLGDQEAGLHHFTVFSERFPDSPWLHLLLGNAYASRHDVTNAETEYRQAEQRDPDLPSLHYALGRLAFDRADHPTALANFRKEIELNPGFGEAYLYLGATLQRNGETADALPFFAKAVERDPNFALTYTQLASAQIKLKQFQAALQTLRIAKAHFPNDAAFPAQLSDLLDRLGRHQEAKDESAIAEQLGRQGNPQLYDASHLDLSPPAEGEGAAVPTTGTAGANPSPSSDSKEIPQVSSLNGEAGEERSVVGTHLAAELDPLRNCLARADRKCAIDAFSKVQDTKFKDDPEYLDLSAQVMSLERKTTEALAAVDRAIKMEPTRADYLMTQGQIYQRSHDQIDAIQSFLQAAKLRPEWVEPAYSLGMSFFILGNEDNNIEYYDRGARHFQVALELDPNCHKAEFMLGVIEALEDRLEKGKEHIERALRMSPRNAYYHLHYGILLNRMGDSKGALREMKLAESLDHFNPLTYLNLGLLEARLQNYAEARKRLETAVQLDSNLSSAYYSLVRVYRHLGLSELSQAAYKKFQLAKAREQQEEADPVEAALSPSDLHSRDSSPK